MSVKLNIVREWKVSFPLRKLKIFDSLSSVTDDDIWVYLDSIGIKYSTDISIIYVQDTDVIDDSLDEIVIIFKISSYTEGEHKLKPSRETDKQTKISFGIQSTDESEILENDLKSRGINYSAIGNVEIECISIKRY